VFPSVDERKIANSSHELSSQVIDNIEQKDLSLLNDIVLADPRKSERHTEDTLLGDSDHSNYRDATFVRFVCEGEKRRVFTGMERRACDLRACRVGLCCTI